MASARQRQRGSFGDIIEIDEAEPGMYRVGHAIDAVADHAIPLRKAVLHVGGWLQNRDVEGGGEQHLLDPQLVPVMRHRFDLRMQYGMVDEAGDAQIGRGSYKPLGENDFVRANVRTDVMDRIRPPHRPGNRMRIAHLARDDRADTHFCQRSFMRGASHESAYVSATCES